MLKTQLKRLLKEYQTKEGIIPFSALRDILTDLHHLADDMGLKWEEAIIGANIVYDEECIQNGRIA